MSEHSAHHHKTHDDGASTAADGTNADHNGAEGPRAAIDPAAAWDERYRTRTQLWSGNPNPQLVREAGGLKPGHALELGCGEGADAIWLAHHGWTVTAVDVSAVALERAQSHEKAVSARGSVQAATAQGRPAAT